MLKVLDFGRKQNQISYRTDDGRRHSGSSVGSAFTAILYGLSTSYRVTPSSTNLKWRQMSLLSTPLPRDPSTNQTDGTLPWPTSFTPEPAITYVLIFFDKVVLMVTETKSKTDTERAATVSVRWYTKISICCTEIRTYWKFSLFHWKGITNLSLWHF